MGELRCIRPCAPTPSLKERIQPVSKQASKHTKLYLYTTFFFVKGNAVWASNKVKKTSVYTNSRCVWVCLYRGGMCERHFTSLGNCHADQ